MPQSVIRDFLYLDFDKASSIWSQLEGGLREKVSVTQDAGSGQKAGVNFGIPKVAEVNLGVDYTGKRSILETKLLHHHILNRIDAGLTQSNLVVDLTEKLPASESDPGAIRNVIEPHPYIKATGTSVIEDYHRILSISLKYNEIMRFIGECGKRAVINSPEYKALQVQVRLIQEEIKKIHNKGDKTLRTAELRHAEEAMKAMATGDVIQLDDWLINGIKLWIDTFMPTRINFRVYPFPKCPSFQVICNLKRDCFVDQDPDHLIYGYSNKPNVPLTVFGLVTSLPPLDQTAAFDPLKEFESAETSDQIRFEQGFRNLFGAMETLEAMMRYSRYPNITVHPIAVYRSFTLS